MAVFIWDGGNQTQVGCIQTSYSLYCLCSPRSSFFPPPNSAHVSHKSFLSPFPLVPGLGLYMRCRGLGPPISILELQAEDAPGGGNSEPKEQVKESMSLCVGGMGIHTLQGQALMPQLPQGYMRPLKQPENSLLCDPALVDEIFDQIPELLEHHEQFLEQVRHCVQTWHAQQKVGDLLLQSVSGPLPLSPREF